MSQVIHLLNRCLLMAPDLRPLLLQSGIFPFLLASCMGPQVHSLHTTHCERQAAISDTCAVVCASHHLLFSLVGPWVHESRSCGLLEEPPRQQGHEGRHDHLQPHALPTHAAHQGQRPPTEKITPERHSVGDESLSVCACPPQIISNEKPETTVKIFNSADLQCPDVIWSTHYRLICQGAHSPVSLLCPCTAFGPRGPSTAADPASSWPVDDAEVVLSDLSPCLSRLCAHPLDWPVPMDQLLDLHQQHDTDPFQQLNDMPQVRTAHGSAGHPSCRV